MNASPILTITLALICVCLPACNLHKEERHEEAHQIVATSPQLQAVTLTQQFVCQIHSQRHIKVRALQTGYLEAIKVREGQQVKEDDVLFKVVPILYQKKAEVELAEARLAELELNYNKELFRKNVVSQNQLTLLQTKLAKARAEADLAMAELNFATVKAPFDGIIDRLCQQQGNLVEDGEILTTLSDNSVMWVYFNVPEKRYLEYMANLKQNKDLKIELLLASGNKFEQLGAIGAIEADFNNETGNIPFRADFKNPIISYRQDGQPERLLRHGQTGTVLLSWVENNALVIPQRATFEVLAKRYVYAIDEENVAHQREIAIENELEDLFVIKQGEVGVNDKIILEGIRQVRDGEKVEYEDRQPDQVVANLKYHAE